MAKNSFEHGEQSGDWEVTSDRSTDGQRGARPPLLDDLGKAIFEFSCADRSHSMLRFRFSAGSFGSIPAGHELRFFVDGELYENFSTRQSNGFSEMIVVSLPGQHTYRWEASVDVGGRPEFWIDDIRCFDVPQAENATGRFDFDDGFVPREMTMDSEWQVTNGSVQGGEAALRPPILDDLGKAVVELHCDVPHTSFSFFYVAGSFGSVPRGQELRFYVDDELYENYSVRQSNGFRKSATLVRRAPHKYKWEASVDTAARPQFWIDTISCEGKAISANATGRFDFDDGFVPEEFSGTWVINNASRQSGEYAAQPPLLDDNGEAEFRLDCDRPHSRISFYYVAGSFGSVPTGQRLVFYVDDVEKEILSDAQSNGFRLFSIDVDPDEPHEYKWVASVERAARPQFFVDTITCGNP